MEYKLTDFKTGVYYEVGYMSAEGPKTRSLNGKCMGNSYNMNTVYFDLRPVGGTVGLNVAFIVSAKEVKSL